MYFISRIPICGTVPSTGNQHPRCTIRLASTVGTKVSAGTRYNSDMNRTCPFCSNSLAAEATFCRSCQKDVAAFGAEQSCRKAEGEELKEPQTAFETQSMDAQGSEPEPAVKHTRRSQFSIASILIIIAAVAVVLALFRHAPGLAFFAMVLLAPPMIRAWVHISREQAAGNAQTIGQKAMRLLMSICLLAVILLSFGVTFVVTCIGVGGAVMSTGGNRGVGVPFAILTGITSGILTQLLVSISFIVWLVRNRRSRTNLLGDVGFLCACSPYFQSVAWVTMAFVFMTGEQGRMVAISWSGTSESDSLFVWLAIAGLILGLVTMWREPRFLACMAVGLAASHLIMYAVKFNSFRRGFSVLETVAISIFILGLASGPLIGFVVYLCLGRYQKIKPSH